MNHDEDRLAELPSIGAGHAANALSVLLDRTLLMAPPRCRKIKKGEAVSSLFAAEDRVVAVFSDLNGALTGQAGLLLSFEASDHLLSCLIGSCGDAPFNEREQSALRELGNIAISAAAGAFSMLEGGLVLPTVPRLAYHEGLHTMPLEDACVGLGIDTGCIYETELIERDGPLRIRFLWVPRQP